MPRRIPDEVREEISRLYDDGNGLKPAEIARVTGVSYASAYGMTRARQITNPETGEKFESKAQYREYLARQITNPETGEKFESGTQYHEYLARQRTERKENRELSYLIKTRLAKMGKTQKWLAKQLDVTSPMITFYTQGISVPKKERLAKLKRILDPKRDRGKSLDELVE
jgi:ribosome-binding protein aMBF1 (putative translation factor)